MERSSSSCTSERPTWLLLLFFAKRSRGAVSDAHRRWIRKHTKCAVCAGFHTSFKKFSVENSQVGFERGPIRTGEVSSQNAPSESAGDERERERENTVDRFPKSDARSRARRARAASNPRLENETRERERERNARRGSGRASRNRTKHRGESPAPLVRGQSELSDSATLKAPTSLRFFRGSLTERRPSAEHARTLPAPNDPRCAFRS